MRQTAIGLFPEVTANTFDLVGSVFVHAWTVSGTTQKINSKAVVLAAAQTANIDLCNILWTLQNTASCTLGTYGKESYYNMMVSRPRRE